MPDGYSPNAVIIGPGGLYGTSDGGTEIYPGNGLFSISGN